MSKILIYSDNHFCSYSSILRGRGKKYSLRLENQLATMRWLKDIAEQYSCNSMWCLGDFFDKSTLNAEELAALSKIKFPNCTQHFLVGNHEMGLRDNSFSSAHTFLLNNDCEVYDKPAILAIDNTLIYVLPYQLNTSSQPNAVEYFPNIDSSGFNHKLLLSHNDLKGAKFGNFVSKTGLDINKLSENFNLTVNGHLHNHGLIEHNVINIGNITGQNFGEDGFKYKHYAMIYDCCLGTYELIENPVALNFFQLNLIGKDIDYINKISPKLSNGVCIIKCDEKDFKYINYRFNPACDDEQMRNIHCPKNCNIVQCRVIVENRIEDTETLSTNNQNLNYNEILKTYLLNKYPSTICMEEEINEVLKR